MLVTESFLSSLIEIYGRHIYCIFTDGGTWYPEACSSPGLKHRSHTPFEKSLIERAIQYFKDRTEHFDDYYYPCIKSGCDLSRVYKWLGLFVCMRNAMTANIKFCTLNYIIGGETS
jgi:putative transposase